jgi:dimethylsulfoniopropionate demethylase
VRQIRPVEIHGDAVPPCDRLWPVMVGDKQVGHISSAAYSPDFATNVAVGMVRMTHWDAGNEVDVVTPQGIQPATVWETFWT